MSADASTDAPICFELPGGRLSFREGDLDVWAEHLEWCYRMLGLGGARCIAVQDFGTSPLAFLGSSLLMPTLAAGAAERLGARLICLDASPERVVITPQVIRQLAPDVLVVRADVLGLLLEVGRRSGVDLAQLDALTVAAIGPHPAPLPPGPWRRLLHAEASMLLAPECAHCGSFHLRAGTYRLADDGRVDNLLLEGAASCRPAGLREIDDRCPLGPEDRLFRLAGPGDGSRA